MRKVEKAANRTYGCLILNEIGAMKVQFLTSDLFGFFTPVPEENKLEP